MAAGWNHNIHYQPMLVNAALVNAKAVLYVGCGVGSMTRALHGKANTVVGIDLVETSLAPARDADRGDTNYIAGDVLRYPFASDLKQSIRSGPYSVFAIGSFYAWRITYSSSSPG